MKLSKTFFKTLDAYDEGYRFIINQGGSRSSKTYSTLQLLYWKAKKSKTAKIIHVISISIPHLRDGAITDFDQILQSEGENLDEVKIKTPYTYTIGKSTIRFIGADKIGGILGAQRDILFINEANNMKWKVVHQLIQRTTETVFIDYNPSTEFWVDTEGISQRENAIVINSTFLDNIENLTESQITEFQEGEMRHDEEVKRDQKGHWYNWWRVYGCGLRGQIQGTIFSNWETGEFDDTLPVMYGIDFGFKDPFTLLKVAFDKKNGVIYLHEEIYKSKLAPTEIIKLLEAKIPNKQSLIIADSADPTQIRGIKNAGFNVMGLGKEKIVIGIRHLQNWRFIVTPTSLNLLNELRNYVWLDKTGEVPIDAYNHLLDPLRYTEKFYRYKNS
jgi:phage terminase large subunit